MIRSFNNLYLYLINKKIELSGKHSENTAITIRVLHLLIVGLHKLVKSFIILINLLLLFVHQHIRQLFHFD